MGACRPGHSQDDLHIPQTRQALRGRSTPPHPMPKFHLPGVPPVEEPGFSSSLYFPLSATSAETRAFHLLRPPHVWLIPRTFSSSLALGRNWLLAPVSQTSSQTCPLAPWESGQCRLLHLGWGVPAVSGVLARYLDTLSIVFTRYTRSVWIFFFLV